MGRHKRVCRNENSSSCQFRKCSFCFLVSLSPSLFDVIEIENSLIRWHFDGVLSIDIYTIFSTFSRSSIHWIIIWTIVKFLNCHIDFIILINTKSRYLKCLKCWSDPFLKYRNRKFIIFNFLPPKTDRTIRTWFTTKNFGRIDFNVERYF